MSLDFIPIDDYTHIYYHSIMLVTLVTLFHSQSLSLQSRDNWNYLNVMGPLLLAFVAVYIGFRPIDGKFIDMVTYNRIFEHYAHGGGLKDTKDVLFHRFTQFSAQFMSANFYFFVCACIYIIPLYLISKKWFGHYWFYAFLLFVGSFSFWSYGTNGIRNGMAGSLFLLGISRKKYIFQALWLIIAINIHKTMLLPTLGYIVVQFYNNPYAFYAFWLLCIPLSLALPGFWENLFAGLVSDERAGYFTKEAAEGKFKSVGFRWDFLFYSSFGVIAGWYYLFKKKIDDKRYTQLYNIYLFANGFWILVIRANFSNRFAYLSWFIMAIVVAYPWGKYYFMPGQYKKFGFVMLAYVGFTYLMHFVYYG